jgi:hypothetical protein
MSIPKCLKLGSQDNLAQGMHIWMEKFLGNWPIINPSHMKDDMNEANANYNPFPTIYVEDNLASLFYELGLQGNPIVYQICLRNSNDLSCCFMFHNLTTPKHNTKVATSISPIHATCTTILKHKNSTINVGQTSPYGIPFNLGTYDASPNVSPTTNHTHSSPKTHPTLGTNAPHNTLPKVPILVFVPCIQMHTLSSLDGFTTNKRKMGDT